MHANELADSPLPRPVPSFGLFETDVVVGEYLENYMHASLSLGFDFVILDLYDELLDNVDIDHIYLKNKSTVIESDQSLSDGNMFRRNVLGLVSEYLVEGLHNSVNLSSIEKNINLQIEHAAFLNISTVMIKFPRDKYENSNFEAITNVCSIVQKNTNIQYWFCFSVDDADQDQFYRNCNFLHKSLHFEKNVKIVLEMWSNSKKIDDWFVKMLPSIPLAAVILNTEGSFLKNSKNFPYLKHENRNVVRHCLNFECRIILNSQFSTSSTLLKNKYTPFMQYVNFLNRRMPPLNYFESFTKPYRDVLQLPLQPLKDNLSSDVYEIFEKDPVKYHLYEKAIRACLRDNFINSNKVRIMVAGAGRGPLVDCVLNAAGELDVENFEIFALEKNIHAVMTLHHKNKLFWGGRVTVVHHDMRTFCDDEKFDIIVSELLGSFSDNELSPECLDQAKKFIKDGGFFIPYSYSSYLSCVSAPAVYSQIVDSDRTLRNSNFFETPLVCNLFNSVVISKTVKCFEFTHSSANDDNLEQFCSDRQTKITFSIPEKILNKNTVMHGFAGYFNCYLYKSTSYGIHPDFSTPDMISWFPMFFPLRNPILLTENDKNISVEFYRKSDENCVWYEWTVANQPHNVDGNSYKIKLN